MKRFVPKSLIGQIALVMALALLVAQAINFTLLFVERQRAIQSEIEGPVISRFIGFAARFETAPPPLRAEMLDAWSRRSRYTSGPATVISEAQRDPGLEARLREAATAASFTIRDARAGLGNAPPHMEVRGARDTVRDGRADRRRDRGLGLSVQLRDGTWLNARMPVGRGDPWAGVRLAASTLLLYLVLLAAMVWIAARMGRPLRHLANAADSLKGAGETPHVTPSGPADIQRAITAFNAMSTRVSAMLVEKDRMLGAIGHDLRTPLASLRIRAESVEPEEERARMIATIEEMTAMLDDTLALARSGRGVEEPRAIDVAALADTVVEEFLALGQPVEMASGARIIACIQPNLIRRAVRNLVDNAVKYGGTARVSVRTADAGTLAIEISDEGPGIPEAELGNAQEAFYRVEPSRSRETGGSGLGLTLARAAAQAHGGSLELHNRPEGGLLVRIILPL